MNIQYRKSVLFVGKDNNSYIPGELKDCPGGHYIQNPDNSIVSVQPNGDVDTRPPGTNPGAYEICQVDDSVNVLRFSGAGTPYCLPYHG